MTALEFQKDVQIWGVRKLVPKAIYTHGVICTMIRLAVLIEYRLCDGRTDDGLQPDTAPQHFL